MSKNPTEAELVAQSNNLVFVELFQKFLVFVTNCEVKPPLIYQDNTSVITTVTQGGGATRAKHMGSRMHLVLEAVREVRVAVKYVHTSGMIADGTD